LREDKILPFFARFSMFTIEYAKAVAEDLANLRAFDRKQLLDHIDEQLTHQPTQETRNKKILIGLVPPWEHEEPIWELRVGEHRIFYDVDEEAERVIVRAIRHKPPHKTTEEIL
jgi:mRNA-degrading endonuclease RelE of RelBE toxin-antitoxin system